MNRSRDSWIAVVGGWWTRLYTLGMSSRVRQRRCVEVDSWLWEQRVDALSAGASRWTVDRLLLTTLARGAIDDLAWRRDQSRAAAHAAGSAPHSRGSHMDKLFQDVGQAFKAALRSPGFAATAVITLALGIGANVAIFGLTNTMLFKALPYPEGHELMTLWETNEERGFDEFSLSPLNYLDWREQQQVFTDIAAFDDSSFTLLSGGDPERVDGVVTSAGLFDVLEIDAALGRVFTEVEDQPGGAPVVVMSDGLWKRRFAADPGIIGESIVIDGEARVVIGVMPENFNFPREEQLWMPLALDPAEHSRASHSLMSVARLRDGVTMEQAQVEMAGIASRLEQSYPETNRGFSAAVKSMRQEEIGDEKILVFVLTGVVSFVLLIACANVANLTLARASGRRRELAVRAALGAGRARLVRQLLTESIVLAAVGGVLGMALGGVGKEMIVAAFPPGVPTWLNWDFDATVYGFAVGVTLLTGVLFGFIPALQASRGNLGNTLRSTGRSGGGKSRTWLRSSLVVAEVALAMILLIGAGLMVRAYINMMAVDPGFNPNDLLTLRVALPESQYESDSAQEQFYRDLIERVAAVPGVDGVGAASMLPVGSFGGTYLAIEGSEATETGNLPVVTYTRTTPGYLEMLGVPLIEGRTFNDRDGADGTPEVLLVTRTAAERFWPEESPVGQRVKFGPIDDQESAFKTVVGVVDDVMQTGIGDDFFPGVYVPFQQSPGASMNVLARYSGDLDGVVGSIRQEVLQLDGNLPIYDISTLTDRIARDDWEQKLFTRIFSAMAMIALVLASVGLYGLVSYSVSQRTREIGVRMALGADRAKVVTMVVRQGIRLTAIGLVLGAIGALGVTRVLSSLLFGVSATDPVTFGGIFLVLTLVAVAASYLPARRATRVDPVAALR